MHRPFWLSGKVVDDLRGDRAAFLAGIDHILSGTSNRRASLEEAKYKLRQNPCRLHERETHF
jgi:hypothetical protein